MKLRQSLEDFIVEEVHSVDVRPENGPYKIYLMEKRGLETFSLISYLAKANGIPFKDFGYAGLKDRHAITRQLISVPSGRGIRTLHEKSFDLELKGHSDSPIRPGQLNGNRFMINVRDLTLDEVDGAIKRAAMLRECGVPNYFDSQRFGSVPHGEFIAKHLLGGEYERAMRIFLTHYDKKEKREVKEDKRSILANWDDLSKAEIRSRHLQVPVETYLRTGSWEEAYLFIARNIRELFLSAYQSHLWNECVKELLRSDLGAEHLEEVRYSLGTLLFLKDIEKKDLDHLPVELPVLGRGVDIRPEEKGLISMVLGKEGVSLEGIRTLETAGDHPRSYRRNVVLRTEDLLLSEPLPDELNTRPNKERCKITVSFQISKGSYGTVIIKGLFGK